jgi:hypothetical protein
MAVSLLIYLNGSSYTLGVCFFFFFFFFSIFVILQAVGLLLRVISSSQGLYLNTGQHKQNKYIHIPNIHALYGIRKHDPGFRASEDSTCLRPLCYRDRQVSGLTWGKYPSRISNKLPEIFDVMFFLSSSSRILAMSYTLHCHMIEKHLPTQHS